MTLNQKDKDEFERIIEKANNTELYTLQEQLDKEIRLSETCIKEGHEERK